MLSNRLKIIASFVPHDSNVADIGCDHGYLLISLKDNHFKGKLLGIDNKKGPLETFRRNLILHGYQNSIAMKLSDGLKDVDNNFNTIVIAGMGFDSIKRILLKNVKKLDNIDYFIIDSHTKEDEIRKLFVGLGYFIDKEAIISENNIYYEIIRFAKGNKEYSDIEYKFGPILKEEKTKIFISKWSEKLRRNNELISMENIDEKRRKKLIEENDFIYKVIN